MPLAVQNLCNIQHMQSSRRRSHKCPQRQVIHHERVTPVSGLTWQEGYSPTEGGRHSSQGAISPTSANTFLHSHVLKATQRSTTWTSGHTTSGWIGSPLLCRQKAGTNIILHPFLSTPDGTTCHNPIVIVSHIMSSHSAWYCRQPNTMETESTLTFSLQEAKTETPPGDSNVRRARMSPST
jgi:hypothetical protein